MAEFMEIEEMTDAELRAHKLLCMVHREEPTRTPAERDRWNRRLIELDDEVRNRREAVRLLSAAFGGGGVAEIVGEDE